LPLTVLHENLGQINLPHYLSDFSGFASANGYNLRELPTEGWTL